MVRLLASTGLAKVLGRLRRFYNVSLIRKSSAF